MVSDNIRQTPVSRKAGRGLIRALKGLFGRGGMTKAGESWQALKDEFRKGRDEAEEPEAAPKKIPYREVEPSSDEPEPPPPASSSP